MLTSRFILLFEGPSRIVLHTLIFKTHIIFLIQCIATACFFKLCHEHSILAMK